MDTATEQMTSDRKNNKLAFFSILPALVYLLSWIPFILVITLDMGREMEDLFAILVVWGPIPLGLTSFITGIIARRQIKKRNEKGSWMAVIGMILGALEAAGGALLILLGVVMAFG